MKDLQSKALPLGYTVLLKINSILSGTKEKKKMKKREKFL